MKGHYDCIGIRRRDSRQEVPNSQSISCRVLLHKVESKRNIVRSERLPIIPLHILTDCESYLCVITVPLIVSRQHGGVRATIHIYKVQRLIDQTQTGIGMTIIDVKTGLSEIVGLSSYFKDMFGSRLIRLRGTTAGYEYH